MNLGIAIILLPLIFWLVLTWLASYTRHDEYVLVPDFHDLKIRQLDDFIADKNLGYMIIDSLWDPKLQKGIVIRQDPDAGDSVKQGRTIYLYVSATTPPTMNMPKLEDLSLRQAMAVAESYGLKLKPFPTDDPCDGCVVRQEYKGKRIEPGSPVRKGETIVIYVGEGEGQSVDGFPVPDLIGMNYRAARGKLLDMKLDWVVIADRGVKDTLNAIVYAQNPSPEKNVRLIRGATIDLMVTNDQSKLPPDTLKDETP